MHSEIPEERFENGGQNENMLQICMWKICGNKIVGMPRSLTRVVDRISFPMSAIA